MHRPPAAILAEAINVRRGGWRYSLWPGSATHALAHARWLTGAMNERAKARLDWKFEVAFGLLEVFDRLVSTVGAIPWVKVTKCSGPAEWHR